jgi:hypothetical protein
MFPQLQEPLLVFIQPLAQLRESIRIQGHAIPTATLTSPSIKKIHLHPSSHPNPCIFVIANANNPLNAPASALLV